MLDPSHFPLLQLLVAFGAMSFTFVIFRLSSFNTFIDHRKTVLRSVSREVCEAYPDLLLLIQNIAKTNAPDKELTILGRIHPVATYLASDIHGFRRRYKRLLLFLFIVILLLIAAGVYVVNVSQIPVLYSCVCGAVIVIWMFYVWSSLRLERPKDLRALELEKMMTRLEHDADEIEKFAKARRDKLIRGADA